MPKGITKVFRSASNTNFAAPRIFQDDTPEDKRAIQDVLNAGDDLSGVRVRRQHEAQGLEQDPRGCVHGTERRGRDALGFPDKIFDQLPAIFADTPPLPGEEARYAQVLAVLDAAKNNPALKDAMIKAAAEADEQLVTPLFQFRNYGEQLPHNWSTISNEAAFGTDYFTRTAVAKSNILVNSPNETKYFYQDFDADAARLNGANRYTVTFAKGSDAAGQRLLVAHALQRASFLREE